MESNSKRANKTIREAAEAKGVRLWEIASALGMYDFNFSRKLRVELPQTEQTKILALIDEIAAKKEAEHNG